MKKILILASNPRGDLRIDREIRDLKKAIKRNKNAAQFEVEIELAVRPEDLQELVFDNKPYIVHFCGHGTGEQGLVFENDTEGEQLLSNQALSGLFQTINNDVECILYANAAINLDWKNNPDAVLRPFEGIEEIPVDLDESFEGLQPTKLLNQTELGKTLLILGDPGSGKTITLLQLAQKLVNQTEGDLTLPIPVVFNLSSWGQKQQPIEKWLIEELVLSLLE